MRRSAGRWDLGPRAGRARTRGPVRFARVPGQSADRPVTRDEDIDVVRHVLQQLQSHEVLLDRVIGAVPVIQHRNEEVRQHVAGHENPAIIDQQCRMAWRMCRMLDDPDVRAIPRNLRSSGRQTGDEAEWVQRDVLGDFWR